MKENAKIEEVWEMGAPSSYLTELLHNLSFALDTIELNHLAQGRYGPTRCHLHPTTTVPLHQ
jgi:hypothetical protein